jgi:transglutaminase-like putative cysteine protease
MSPRRAGSLLLTLLLSVLSGASHADGPLLHEYIEPNPSEDLELGATTPDGRMPAAARTPSGVISAPGFSTQGPARQVAYGGSATPDSIDATYRIDRDTTRPEAVDYDDPFTPAIAPFKRLYAFDAVDRELELVVYDRQTRRVPVGGTLGANEDHFFGDLFVDLAAKVPVRIPTVGPGTRVLALRAEPPTELEIVRDGAENFFVVGSERRRVRLILELSAPRSVFGSEFPEVSYDALSAWATPLPSTARATVVEVLNGLGLSRAVPPATALQILVAHFRSFAPSDDLPLAASGAALYRELVLSKKGVCRHRAYAFVLTAHGLGIPARFVRNEAHAWVEVGDGKVWHRIDLGGAAGRFDLGTRPGAPPHQTPPDPFPWPEGADGALDSAANNGPPGSNAPGNGGPTPANPSGAAGGSGVTDAPQPGRPGGAASELSTPAAPVPTAVGPALERAEIELGLEQGDVRRGMPLRVTGRVNSSAGVCAHARVDLSVQGPTGEVLIGSIPTDAEGRYDSQVTIPFDIDVGDYTLRASTPGTASCGASD